MENKDYITNIKNAERRFLPMPIEVRAEGDDQYFEGMAAVFNSATDLGFFSEEIAQGAFDDVINDDVRGLFNHDPNVILGRSQAGTMTLTVDEKGAHYRIKYNPNDPDHVRVMEKVKRGDISQSSFAFSIKDAEWQTRDNKDHRVINKLERWYDVSPVTYPAYADTSVAARSLDSVKAETHDMTDTEEERNQYLRNYYELIIK